MKAKIPRRTALISIAILAGLAVAGTIGFIVTKEGAVDSDESTPSGLISSGLSDTPRDVGVSCGLGQYEELPLPEGVDGIGGNMVISDSGEYIAGTATDAQLIRWHHTEPEVVDRGVGDIADINDSGDIVGVGDDRSIWVYRDEDMTPLWPKAAGTADVRDDRTALTIRNDGTVVAAIWSDESKSSQILTWEPQHEEPTQLNFEEDELNYISDFDEDGNAVGGTEQSRRSTPMMWDLSAPAAEPRVVEEFYTEEIDARGIIYGTSELSGGDLQYVDADGSGVLPLPESSGHSASLHGVDSAGTTAIGKDQDNAYIWTCD